MPNYANRFFLVLMAAIPLSCPWGVGCGGSSPTGVATTASDSMEAGTPTEQLDVSALAAREFNPLSKTELMDPSGKWKASVEAAGPVESAVSEGFTTFTIPLGTESPAACFVYDETIDAASAAQAYFKAASNSVNFKQIGITDVVLADETPVLLILGLYTIDRGGNSLMGSFKLAVFPHSNFSTVCTHDELGYQAAFRRVVLGLFKSYQRTDGKQTVPADHVQIWAAKIGDQPIGFAKETITAGEAGKVTHLKTSSMLIPRSSSALLADDSASVVHSDRKGIVTKGVWFRSENAALSAELTLERIKKKKYAYSGKFKKKEVAGEFTTRSSKGLPSDVYTYRRIGELVKHGKAETITVESYSPNGDPSTTIDVEYDLTVEGEIGNLTIRMGNLIMSAIADQNGGMEVIEMPMMGKTLVLQRILVRGSMQPN